MPDLGAEPGHPVVHHARSVQVAALTRGDLDLKRERHFLIRGDRSRDKEALVRGAVAVTAGRPRHPGQGIFAQAAQACAAGVIGGFHPGGVARVAQGHRGRNR